MRWREIGRPQANLGDGTRAKLNGQPNDDTARGKNRTDVLKPMREVRVARRAALMRPADVAR